VKWVEEQHPRHNDGRFKRKGASGGWVEAVSDTMTRGYVPVRGRDLTDELDYEPLDAIEYVSGEGDPWMHQIWAAQGFDGPPHVVDGDEWEQLQAEGGLILHRGVRGRKDIGVSAEGIAERYVTGEHYAGLGIFGSGSYFSTGRQTGEKYSTGAAYGTVTFNNPQRYEGSATIEAMLLPSARILDWTDDSKRLRQEVGGMDEFDIPADARQRILADEGRMAAALGYDALRIRTHMDDTYGDEIIVLNRTATAVRRR